MFIVTTFIVRIYLWMREIILYKTKQMKPWMCGVTHEIMQSRCESDEIVVQWYLVFCHEICVVIQHGSGTVVLLQQLTAEVKSFICFVIVHFPHTTHTHNFINKNEQIQRKEQEECWMFVLSQQNKNNNQDWIWWVERENEWNCVKRPYIQIDANAIQFAYYPNRQLKPRTPIDPQLLIG